MAFRFNQGDRPLPGYTIGRGVGRGGFGEVYYATSDGGKEVALKYLRENPQVELRGVQHCLNLKSPHLVAIHDIKQSPEGEHFVIMEYVSGPSLRDLLNSEAGGLGAQKAAYFLREIGKGLAYLHDRGIVHRDLKPGNIFYEDGYVKIGDYGLAKIMAASQHSGQTMSVGTVHYMAPEVGSGNYDRTIDIYALGVMLYEMLLGKVPFSGATMGEVLMKHLTAQPVVDELPAPFPNVIRKALAKDPKDRYQTVQEMVSELFDVADIEQSVAAFEPASMTQLAAKVGAALQPVAVGQGGVAALGTGSSNVGQAAIPPVINPPTANGGRVGRLERLHDRVQGRLNALAERVDRTAMGRKIADAAPNHKKRTQIIAGVVISTGGKRAEIIASTLTTAALTSLAIGFVSDSHHGLLAALSSFILMAAIVGGVIVGTYLGCEKIKSTGDWTPRLLITGLTTAWSASALAFGRIGYKNDVRYWFAAVILIMLLSDWLGRFNDGRRGVVSAGKAFKVGLFAFIVANILDCNVALMGFSVLMASLLVQMLAGIWPVRAAAETGPTLPQLAADFRAPAPPAVAISRSTEPTITQAVHVEHGSGGASASAQSIQLSPGVRTAWLVLSIPVLIAATVWFIAAGLLGDNDHKLGELCIGGVMSATCGLFMLMRGLTRIKRGVFRDLIRPFIFFIGAGSAASCGIGAGLLSGHSNRDMFPWVVGTVVFGLAALSIWLIPVAPWQPVEWTPERLALRRKRSGQWMLGIGIALVCCLIVVVSVLDQTLDSRQRGIVIPAFAAPTFSGAVLLIIFGAVRLAGRQNERLAKLALPIRRVFEMDDAKNIGPILERHLQAVGYTLASRDNLRWTFTRGQWHSQFWKDDIRQWQTTLNVAAYETYDGGGRVTCYLDLERSFGKPKRRQLVLLDAELDDLRDVLEAREISSAV